MATIDPRAAVRFVDSKWHAGASGVAAAGRRRVVLALAEVANRHPETRLGHVVLLAPDMDFGIFERILPRIRPIVASMTVYATTGDRPLALSAQLHGDPRLGEAGNDVSVLSGVEVIDLSARYLFDMGLELGVNVTNLLDDEHYQTFGGDILGRRGLAHIGYRW